jgi:hypothetical protein
MNGLDFILGSDIYSRLRANLGAGGCSRLKLPSPLSHGLIENRAGNNEQACFSTSHVKAGDLFAITSAGAYGFFVASI